MNRVQEGRNIKTRGSKVFVLLTFTKNMLEIGKEVGILLILSCYQSELFTTDIDTCNMIARTERNCGWNEK